jgi:acetone carboxylase, beta subunit
MTSMVLGRGYDFREYSLFAYGGGGPMHLWGYGRDLGFRNIITFPFAAVFSAFGVLTTDMIYRYHKGLMAACPPGEDPVSRGIKEAAMHSLNEAWQDLRSRALDDLSRKGLGEKDLVFQHYAYVRYGTQINDFEVPLPFGRIDSIDNLSRVIEAFERVYASLYPKAGRYPEAGYLIMEVAVSAVVVTPRPNLPKLEIHGEMPPDTARKGERQVWWKGEWLPFRILDMERVEAGNLAAGPSILEDPATTLLVPPGWQARFDERRFIWFEER